MILVIYCILVLSLALVAAYQPLSRSSFRITRGRIDSTSLRAIDSDVPVHGGNTSPVNLLETSTDNYGTIFTIEMFRKQLKGIKRRDVSEKLLSACLSTIESSKNPFKRNLSDNLSFRAATAAGTRFTDIEEKLESGVKPLHYVVPATNIESLRQRFGERQSIWGDWSCGHTRRFYRQQLPYSLRIDGALGLSLEERALLAAESRHALRMYARERCVLPGRLLANLYDGLRHLARYGSWNVGGITWGELLVKYKDEAYQSLGEDVDDESVTLFIHRRIVEKACMTNPLFDNLRDRSEVDPKAYEILLDLCEEAVENLMRSVPPLP